MRGILERRYFRTEVFMGDWYVKQFIDSFLGMFKEMPNRASGNYLEQKSAVIIKNFLGPIFDIDSEYQPFAIDISSGSWNVALHSIFFIISSVGLMLLGYISFMFSASSGAQTVRLGFFGPLPTIYPLLSAVFCLLIIISRFFATYKGWSLFSFFIPNAESGNVECRSKLTVPGTQQTRKLIIFSAHYDTARCLPVTGLGFLGDLARRLAKNGLSVFPTIASIVIFLVFLIHLIFALPAWLSIVLVILGLLALVLIVVEAIISEKSANLPYNPGFNDNLSGVGVLTGIMAENIPNASPPPSVSRFVPQDAVDAIQPAPNKKPFNNTNNTDFIFVFTGSEENGLRGSTEFRANYLKALETQYGKNNIYIINIDNVSGKVLKIFNAEKDFAGLKRGGNQAFLHTFEDFIRNRAQFDKSYLETFFTDVEIGRHFSEKIVGSSLKYLPNLNIDPTFIPSCTDMSGMCSCCDRTRNIITIVGREGLADSDYMPRDYHQLTDTYEKMCGVKDGEYISPIYFLAFALSEFARYIDDPQVYNPQQ
jgi:hypothetical protein